MRFDKEFKEFIKQSKPDFGKFSGPNRCLFLTGGRAIKFSTKEFRQGKRKLPSSDYDFKWVLSKKPTKRDLTEIVTFFKGLVEDFIFHLKVKKGITVSDYSLKQKVFETPILQNPLLKRYSHAFFDFSLMYRNAKHELIDVVVLSMKGASSAILDKQMSDKYDLPIPKLKVLYFETAMVVAKTLFTNMERNRWRNPIKSAHPTEANKYQQKGLKNLNRLSVMRNAMQNKNLSNNINALKFLTRNKNNMNTRLYLGKLVGTNMNAKLRVMNKNIKLY